MAYDDAEEKKLEKIDYLANHRHYSEETQKALQHYQHNSIGMFFLHRCEWSERVVRLESIQAAWNLFIRARKAETGTGFYLDPQEYAKVMAARSKL